MKKFLRLAIFHFYLSCLCLLYLISIPVSAETVPVAGKLSISNPWSHASIPGTRNGAVYLTIQNQGDQRDTLLGASTPIAKMAELHTHVMENDIVKMFAVPHIPIPEKSIVQLKPGGNHIMLFDLTRILRSGDTFPIELNFQRAGKIKIQAKVEAR